VVNKVDTPVRMNRYYEFLGLGLSPVFPLSATHTRGLEELRNFIEERSLEIQATREKEEMTDGEAEFKEGDTRIRIAIVGRPNAGKSTLINHLSGKEVALVSPVAGTTRDVLKTEFKHGKTWYEIWDTAGIRRQSRVGDSVEYYSVHRALESIEMADVVYLLVDAQQDLSTQDKKIAYQVVKKGKPIILCFSKWDLLTAEKNLLEAMTDRLHFLFPILDFAPVVPISSVKGEGFEDLFRKTHRVFKEVFTRLETPRLNEALRTWAADFPPPRPFKVKYLTQVSIDPVKFILFVNQADDFPSSYLSYIKNKIRSLGPAHIPLKLEVRSSS
jgi:GTP-binding protein